jgi:hypothetical protein
MGMGRAWQLPRNVSVGEQQPRQGSQLPDACLQQHAHTTLEVLINRKAVRPAGVPEAARTGL